MGNRIEAFLTSRNTAAICWGLESMACHELVTERRASCVKDRGLNPNCTLESTLLENKNLETLVWTILSRIFDGKREVKLVYS